MDKENALNLPKGSLYAPLPIPAFQVLARSNNWPAQKVLLALVMHMGKNNPKHKYNLNGIEIESSSEERDLGVTISSSGTFDKHVSKAVTKANSILGMFLNTFTIFNEQIAKTVYPTFIRPHLEFAVPVWNPRLKRCRNQIEKVQRRATRSIFGFRGLSYEKRLSKLGITDLQTRRTRGDLIQYYKICKGMDRINWEFVNTHGSTQTHSHSLRGHKYKFSRELTKNTRRHHFFINRVSGKWNQLPKTVVEAKNMNAFKAGLDKWLSKQLSRG
jgi:hypothetical protein